MKQIEHEPVVAVGLVLDAVWLDFELHSEFTAQDGTRLAPGKYRVEHEGGGPGVNGYVELRDGRGQLCLTAYKIDLHPINKADGSFTIKGITIGINFHWEQQEDQQFQGSLRFQTNDQARFDVINEIAVEDYLTSVISSEMSAMADAELLKAHAVISRSWLLAQLPQWKKPRVKSDPKIETVNGERQLIRWYDQESHTDFDICADDHCQRYQGITKATSPMVFDVIQQTFGLVLTSGGELCDARYSKSCGGMTESFDAAWADEKFPYLAVAYDGENFPAEFALPLTEETNAERWIRQSPPAFCNTTDAKVLGKILPDFDRATDDFYRWRVTIAQEELQELLRRKLGVDFGSIHRLEPVERAASGRLVKLRIVGEREQLIIGKELEIRRALSPSHLYSSAFVVETSGNDSKAPEQFTLIGAGWGHGVGLCQIGAALMAERGYDFKQILAHYYHGSQLQALYQRHRADQENDERILSTPFDGAAANTGG